MTAVAILLAVTGLKILENNGYEASEPNSSPSLADTEPPPVESPSPTKAITTYSLSICVNPDNPDSAFEWTTVNHFSKYLIRRTSLSSKNGKLGNQTSAAQKQEQN